MTKWSANQGTATATVGVIRNGLFKAGVIRGGVATGPGGVAAGGVQTIRSGVALAAVIRGAGETGDAAGGVRSARFDVPLGERPRLPTEVSQRLHLEARSAGFAAGWAEGRRAAGEEARVARIQFEAEAAAAIAATTAAHEAAAADALRGLVAAAGRYEEQYVPVVADMEADLIAAAFALAEAIVGRELALATEPGQEALRRALRFAPAGQPVEARLSPAEAAAFPAVSTVDDREVIIVPDPALKPGDAVIRCDATTIESRIDAAIARAREALA
jgi:flagellar assembly protein FliH